MRVYKYADLSMYLSMYLSIYPYITYLSICISGPNNSFKLVVNYAVSQLLFTKLIAGPFRSLKTIVMSFHQLEYGQLGKARSRV